MVIGVRSWCEASWRNRRWVASSRAFSSPTRRDSRSAACLRWACQTIAPNIAAISGTSVSSAAGSDPRITSSPMPAAVVAMTAPSTHSVGAVAQVRNPYSSVKLIQMKWNGIVSQPGNTRIAARLIAEKTAHAASSNPGRKGQLSLTANLPNPDHGLTGAELSGSAPGELISLTAHRLDEAEAELGPQAPHAHVDDVRAGVEVVPPDRRQQLPLRDGLARVLGQLAEQQELEPGQRDGAGTDVGDQDRKSTRL